MVQLKLLSHDISCSDNSNLISYQRTNLTRIFPDFHLLTIVDAKRLELVKAVCLSHEPLGGFLIGAN